MDKNSSEYWGEWLKQMDRQQISDSGKHGILEKYTLPDAVDSVKNFKRMLQRLEWWPDYDSRTVMNYMVEKGISAYELLAMIRAFSLRKEYVLNCLRGNEERLTLFQDPGKKFCNEETICFIACCNNKEDAEEMTCWISKLMVPAGISIDIITVEDAESIFKGYNVAMHSSDAKYKVYLHQDVRILNPYFIYEILDIFKDEQVGLIGMVGTNAIPMTGVMWDVERFGGVVETTYDDSGFQKTLMEVNSANGTMDAQLIDGFIMITQVDLEWREDIFEGWDFYDASQCMEFLLKGYKVIVPEQKIPWCLHDFGETDLSKYEHNRKIFVEHYLNNIHK